jgi:hypothetical protein
MPIPASEMSLRIYYMFIKITYNSLIYIGFLKACFPVNQGVSGQDIGLTLGAGEQAQDEPADNKHQGQLDKAL